MDGLLTEPRKFSEPVSVNCAGGSRTFVTDATPDWINVAFGGTAPFNLIVNVEEV